RRFSPRNAKRKSKSSKPERAFISTIWYLHGLTAKVQENQPGASWSERHAGGSVIGEPSGAADAGNTPAPGRVPLGVPDMLFLQPVLQLVSPRTPAHCHG